MSKRTLSDSVKGAVGKAVNIGALAAASYLPAQGLQAQTQRAQEPCDLRNPAIAWLADSAGNKNGIVDINEALSVCSRLREDYAPLYIGTEVKGSQLYPITGIYEKESTLLNSYSQNPDMGEIFVVGINREGVQQVIWYKGRELHSRQNVTGDFSNIQEDFISQMRERRNR